MLVTRPPTASSRREARERALSLCYEADLRRTSLEEVLAEFPVAPAAYALELACGAESRRPELDELIRRFARDWTLERMPVVDRNLLRIATYELSHCPQVPTAVVINEAVELAKLYSTDNSGRFVNGMLAQIARHVRGGE